MASPALLAPHLLGRLKEQPSQYLQGLAEQAWHAAKDIGVDPPRRHAVGGDCAPSALQPPRKLSSEENVGQLAMRIVQICAKCLSTSQKPLRWGVQSARRPKIKKNHCHQCSSLVKKVSCCCQLKRLTPVLRALLQLSGPQILAAAAKKLRLCEGCTPVCLAANIHNSSMSRHERQQQPSEQERSIMVGQHVSITPSCTLAGNTHDTLQKAARVALGQIAYLTG